MYQKIIKPTIVLALMGFISSMSLAHINRLTRGRIEAREIQKKMDAIRLVLPSRLGYVITENEKKVTVDGKEFTYTVAEKTDGELTVRAYAFLAERNGYSGVVKTMVGVDGEGKIIGISVIQQSETPGLGARVKEEASGDTLMGVLRGRRSAVSPEGGASWFEQQYEGISTSLKIGIMKKGECRPGNDAYRNELLGANSVSAITGATITTKTVNDSIEEGMLMLKKAIAQELPREEATTP